MIGAVAASLALLLERPPFASSSGLLAGRYRRGRHLGAGGMGSVYEATDIVLERRVAVKMIRGDWFASTNAVARFRREAKAAASFTHPHVVTVYDFGVSDDDPAYLVMELLEGHTLREELRESRTIEPARAQQILRGVASAVATAHERRLLHRDLKPENIFVARSEVDTPQERFSSGRSRGGIDLRELPAAGDVAVLYSVGSLEAADYVAPI